MSARLLTRRELLKTAGALLGAGAFRLLAPYAYAGTAGQPPLRVGLQAHRTGIGAVYGKWYERTARAAVRLINAQGGIAGRPVQLVVEDDGTDPRRGIEVVEKLALQHRVDFIFGTLFSNVVVACAPRAAELKIPYLVVSEGYHVPSGKLNRWTFQPGITDVRSQVTAVAPWIVKNLGRRIAMIFPDYAFGYDHRDFFGAAARRLGAELVALVPIPPTETSFTKYFPRIPRNVDVIYHVMVGPAVLTFVREMGEYFGRRRPQLFGFIDSLEGVDLGSPGLEFLEGTYFWEALPRYAGQYNTPWERRFREAVGVDANGASKTDPRDVSTYSHMFGVWETLFVVKEIVERSGYRTRTLRDYRAFVETLEATERFEEGLGHPQGPKRFVGQIHQAFGQQFISRVEGRRLRVVHRTRIEESLYPPEADYRQRPL
ncbi:MAG: ABC transporter substrate-binding protein [Armatimonadetes bacterium]|nr:ABC transporter substrate-binding protein [Armatimonadota bacterium]MDW8152897.1 ABC transporter substrate-binding protein [Armatimonadota bacterium]